VRKRKRDNVKLHRQKVEIFKELKHELREREKERERDKALKKIESKS
jgi:hypothetical protein